jgi:poly(A) polymerase
MIRKLIKNIGKALRKQPKKSSGKKLPVIVPRAEHGISRNEISEHALKVLYRLHKNGYSAYLVGGAVRELLLGKHPKDFDISTDAKPEQVKRLFRNCRIIGRRFRLAHVFFGDEIIEVATFRAASEAVHSEHGMVMADNVFGTLEEDAFRRDFTINALYYNIADFSVVDFMGGMQDIKDGVLRMIGEPDVRFREDPVRILRAVRFCAKLNFKLADNLLAPMQELKSLLHNVSSARLYQELAKLFFTGHALDTYQLLKKQEMLGFLFPITDNSLTQNIYPTDKLIVQVLKDTDERLSQNKSATPAFLFAAMLWHAVCERAKTLVQKGKRPHAALFDAQDEILAEQAKVISIPKMTQQTIKDIWSLQWRLEKAYQRNAFKLFSQLRFRAGLDFLIARNKIGEYTLLADFWQQFALLSEHDKIKHVKQLPKLLNRKQDGIYLKNLGLLNKKS